MAKKTKKRRLNSRLMRTVRKTSAAVLMILALLVAAIPAENLGATGTGSSGTGTTTTLTGKEYTDTRTPYTYSVTDDRTSGGSNPVDGENDSSSSPAANGYYQTVNTASGLSAHHRHESSCTCKKSYSVRLSSNNKYILDWQFKYDGGYLYDYNDEFRVPDGQVLEVPYMINAQYFTVTQSDIDNYFARYSDSYSGDDKLDPYTYTWEDWAKVNGNVTDENAYVLQTFFPNVWSSFVNDCESEFQRYKRDHQSWADGEKDSDGNPLFVDEPLRSDYGTSISPANGNPASITSEDLKFRFYCDYSDVLFTLLDTTKRITINTMQKTPGSLTLVPAFDASGSSSDGTAENVPIYLVKALSPENVREHYFLDDKNFLVPSTDTVSIKYIGDYAFANVKNVKTLKLPSEITCIGDYAFANSFLEGIDLGNVKVIGNASFKNCASLQNVDFSTTNISQIGAEAFAGTGLTSIVMPADIVTIHAGAFARCKSLTSVDFTTIQTVGGCDIYEAAFYDCSNLTNINFDAGKQDIIRSLGEACFGVSVGDDENIDISLPVYLKKLPKHLFVGRKHLKSVVFPVLVTDIPDDIFYQCNGLEKVVFPDEINGYSQSANPNYPTDGSKITNLIFLDVTNKSFCVYGPGFVDGDKANPRRSTWNLFTMVNDFVPYMYVQDGITYYEVCDGTYILNANENGELVSCEPLTTITKGFDLLIPSKVGEYKITSIRDGAFSNANLRRYIQKIIVADDTVETIPAHVFENLPNLKEVDLGNSVTTIGDYAFAKCANLEEVTFRNGNNVTLGVDAFATTGDRLIFHGVIREDYGPFAWAMQADNYVNSNGVRVCYKQTEPGCLTVILNDAVTERNPSGTPVPTLVDYPKYSQLDQVYKQYAIDDIYDTYSTEKYNYNRDRFYERWVAAAGDSTACNEIYANKNLYGPWINELFCLQIRQYTVTTTADSDSADNSSIWNQLQDALLRPLVVSASESSTISIPVPYFTKNNDYSIIEKIQNIENGTTDGLMDWEKELSSNELKWLDACTNIVVPAGVKSIDAKSYFDDMTHNRASISRYFKNGSGSSDGSDGYLPSEIYKMYTEEVDETIDGAGTTVTSVPGLFSGYLEDGYQKTGESEILEEKNRGNDRIESITLVDIEYLPDYAFDSCERLKKVVLGSKLTDIGTLPFRDCTQLGDITGNDNYYTGGGLIIDKRINATGGLSLIECVPSRGTSYGGSSIVPDSLSSEELQLLANVNEIADEAFRDCKSISEVDLSSTDVEVIPERCFYNCSKLETLILPPSAVEILDEACVTNSRTLDVEIPAREVQIQNDAFTHDDSVTFFTPDDSAAARYAKEYGIRLRANNTFKVEFRDYDGTALVDPLYVEVGDMPLVLDNPSDPTSTKQHIYGNGKFPEEIPTRSGYEFVEWVSSNPDFDYPGPITGHVVFSAKYTMKEGTHDGKYYIFVYDGLTGATICDRLDVDPDSDATSLLPTPPTHEGYKFLKWSTEDYKKVDHDIHMIALYEPDTTTDDPSTEEEKPGGGVGNTDHSDNDDDDDDDDDDSSSSDSSSSSVQKKYKVTVEGGTGNGDYYPGNTVIITAANPEAGKAFSKWTTESQGVTFTNAGMMATTFKMPANDVTVKANYVASATTTTPVAGTTQNTSTPGYGDGYGTNNNQKQDEDTNAQVTVSKPGISNIDLATARVNGSSDSFVIKVTETNEAEEQVRNALTNRYGSLDDRIEYWSCDISLYDETGNAKIEDTTGLTVDITLPIPDELRKYGTNNMVGAVAESSLESLTIRFNEINGVPCVTFTATHFSPYTIYVDTQNLVASQMLDATPKTGDPIHPKWFLSIGLACVSILLFMKKDKKVTRPLKAA